MKEGKIDIINPKPCVRCGKKLVNTVEYKNVLGDTYYFCECVACTARTKGWATENKAKEAWQNGEVNENI